MSISASSGRKTFDFKTSISLSRQERMSRRESRKFEQEHYRLILLAKKRADYSEKRAKKSNLLAIKSTTWADDYKLIRKPSGSEIADGLPSWNTGYIGAKLAYIEPEDPDFALTRGKIGHGLLKRSEGAEFRLDNMIEVPYHPLHDRHMKTFLKNHLRFLKKEGLVTEQNGVKCTLKEYNYYRLYLERIHAEALNRFSKKKDEEESEVATMKRLMHLNADFTHRQVQESIRKERAKIDEERRKVEQTAKNDKCKARLDRVAYVLEQKENERRKAALEAEKKNYDFKMWLQKKVVAAEEMERKRKLNAILQRRKIDRQQQVREDLTEKARENNRKLKVEQQWRRKMHLQMVRLESERSEIDQKNQELKRKARLRFRTIKKWDKRRLEQLSLLKKEKKVEVERNVKQKCLGIKRFYEGDIDREVEIFRTNMPKIKFCIKGITDRLENRLRSLCTQEVADVLFMGGQKAKKEKFKLPIEVSVAITYILNSVIEVFVRKKVSEVVPDLVAEAIKMYNSRLEETGEYSSSAQTSSLETSSENTFLNEYLQNLSGKEMIIDSLSYICEKVLKTLKMQIVTYFSNTEESVPGVQDISDQDLRITKLVEYITVTLLNFAETRANVDEDVCVQEIADFIGKQILHTIDD